MRKYILLFIAILFLETKVFASEPTLRTVNNSFVTEELDINYINVNQTKLFPVREVIESFGYKINWDSKTRIATVSKEGFESNITKYTVYKNYIYLSIDNISKYLEEPIFYDGELNIVYGNENLSNKTLKALMPSYEGYTKSDLEWLSKIVNAEARGEAYSSQVDVANVIINRVASPQYPNTIYDVIFDDESGVQFTPTVNGQIYKEPTTKSFLAALEVLEKTDFATSKNKNALFFINPNTATNSWVHRNRVFAFASGNHNFYY